MDYNKCMCVGIMSTYTAHMCTLWEEEDLNVRGSMKLCASIKARVHWAAVGAVRHSQPSVGWEGT